jgi:hypothetical protein
VAGRTGATNIELRFATQGNQQLVKFGLAECGFLFQEQESHILTRPDNQDLAHQWKMVWLIKAELLLPYRNYLIHYLNRLSGSLFGPPLEISRCTA